MAKDKEKVPFEKAIAELEQIIEKLEDDEITLDDALRHFEQGVSLMRACDAHLKSAEGKLRELLKGENGEFVEKALGITLESLDNGEPADE